MAGPAIRDSESALAEFKIRTTSKVSGLRCPIHRRPPRIVFRGTCLRDITIQMSGCCEQLIVLANQRIAEPAVTPGPARAR